MPSIDPHAVKRCTRCGAAKPLDEFYRNRSKRDGHDAACKVCFRAAQAGLLPRRPDHPVRFWAKVERTAGCWEWRAARYPNGYGMYRLNGRGAYAHRVAYELLVGPIPHGLELDHLCRNRGCVNPAHLEPVTHAENSLRGESPAAHNARRDRCAHGHPLTPENTYYHRGHRQCVVCRRAHRAAYRQRRR